jgi:hypothetical protein
MNTNIKKSFKVIFNSNNKVAGSTNSNAYYYIDWSAVLKDNQEYSMSWSYEGQANTFTADSKIATLNINLFANIFVASGTFINGAINSTNIGVLTQGNNGLYGDINFNTPIHFNSRPNNNNVHIQILNNDSPPTEWSDNAAVPVGPNNYILILNFSEL